MRRRGITLYPTESLTWNQIKSYSKEFYDHSLPLLASTIVSVVIVLFDRWFLQKMAGSIEQGYFGLSFQIGGICFVFSNAMSPLFRRDFSIGAHKHSVDGMRNLFMRYVPFLFSVACFLGIYHSSLNRFHESKKDNFKNKP